LLLDPDNFLKVPLRGTFKKLSGSGKIKTQPLLGFDWRQIYDREIRKAKILGIYT
jgi:hypothetical protein